VFGVGRSLTLALVGWLWADILLGLFALFLAANSVGTPLPDKPAGIDPKVVELRVAIDGPVLLSGEPTAAEAEQRRIVAEVERRLAVLGETRRVALLIAFASHASPTEGDRLARLATAAFRGGAFDGAVLKSYHELAPGDPGSTLSLELYVYQ